jgi:hypothetical protein
VRRMGSLATELCLSEGRKERVGKGEAGSSVSRLYPDASDEKGSG